MKLTKKNKILLTITTTLAILVSLVIIVIVAEQKKETELEYEFEMIEGGEFLKDSYKRDIHINYEDWMKEDYLVRVSTTTTTNKDLNPDMKRTMETESTKTTTKEMPEQTREITPDQTITTTTRVFVEPVSPKTVVFEPTTTTTAPATTAAPVTTIPAQTTPASTTAAPVISENFLLTTNSPDPNYTGRVVRVEDRAVLEGLVMGEFGTDYIGAVLVAQTIRDTMVKTGIYNTSRIAREWGYSAAIRSNVSDDVKRAVSFVFDQGGSAVQHQLSYFYASHLIYSSWHETQKFIVQYGGCRFFSGW